MVVFSFRRRRESKDRSTRVKLESPFDTELKQRQNQFKPNGDQSIRTEVVQKLHTRDHSEVSRETKYRVGGRNVYRPSRERRNDGWTVKPPKVPSGETTGRDDTERRGPL